MSGLFYTAPVTYPHAVTTGGFVVILYTLALALILSVFALPPLPGTRDRE